MKTTIKATNLKLTSAIEQYLNKKVGDIDNLLPKSDFELSARIELGKTTFHHQAGNIFRAEINLQVPGKLLRSEAEAETLYAAIDEMKDQIQREIKKYKEKIITKTRKQGRLMKE